MPTSKPPAADLVTRPRDARRALYSHRLVDVSLMVALIGSSVPFGLHNPHSYVINRFEWGLTVCSFIALCGIVYGFVRPHVQAWPYLIAAFVWAATTTYALFLPNTLVIFRIGVATIAFSWAVLCAGMWRWSVISLKVFKLDEVDENFTGELPE